MPPIESLLLTAPIPPDESQRLDDLLRYGILDTPMEPAFDRVAGVAAKFFGAPIAMVTFVDETRQWFKACYGVDFRETSRQLSFCAHAILSSEVMVVPDASLDERFAANALVTGSPHIRFYAGAPLQSPAGYNLGSLCIIDTSPRVFSESDRHLLAELAAMVVDEMTLRLVGRQLSESETRFRSLTQNSHDIISVLAPDGAVLFESASFERCLGHRVDEVVGRNVFEFVHPDDSAAVAGRFADLLKGQRAQPVEFRFRHKDGSWRWLEALGTNRIDDPAVHGVVVNSRDVTQRRSAEADLRASEARKAAILESALDSIISMNQAGFIVDFNPAAERTFGYSRAQAVGQRMADLLVPEELREQHFRGLQRYLETGHAVLVGRRVEVPALRADGSRILVELAITRTTAPDGAAVFTAYLRDITAVKEAEELTRAAKEEAERANRAKSEFLASMSHELRTPLNSIIGFSELLIDETVGNVNEQQRVFLENIESSGRHLLRLINDILDLSKIESGRETGEFVLFDPVDALSAAEQLVKPLAAKKSIALQIVITEKLPQIHADPRRFQQILCNLLSNAIKFTREGGRVSLSAAAEEDADTGRPRLRVSVRDNGVGIKVEDQARIFREFEQVDSSYARGQEGTGLGLALTQRLVQLHGGIISVESEGVEGKGSTFSFVLPSNGPS